MSCISLVYNNDALLALHMMSCYIPVVWHHTPTQQLHPWLLPLLLRAEAEATGLHTVSIIWGSDWCM